MTVVTYNEDMERIVDKTIIAICCLAVLFLTQQTVFFIVGLLLAVSICALQEITPVYEKIRASALYAYLVIALVFPVFALFMPLVSYDCMRKRNWALKLCWILPVIAIIRAYDLTVLLFLLVVSTFACILSWRTARVEAERIKYRELRDELRELSLSLEQKNRNLQEKQDYEVRLATLTERGRIAREIHDNVGHLLTRSVLQIEAAQVVYQDDARVREDLEQLGKSIHEAFDTVRASVHDLHDDSFDLYTQLYAIAQGSQVSLNLEYQADEIPDAIGYGFVAIVRESVANAARHSNASRVNVSVVEYPAFYQLVVHDNGDRNPFKNDGIELEETGGIGLRTMEERARSLGGVLRIDYDRGFRVFVSVPKDLSKEFMNAEKGRVGAGSEHKRADRSTNERNSH